ncbi:hypothetical protein [Rhizobium sp. S96]|uniref:hypothetical protein n=1 Tax=Rhizobium sp. S96 TaxID=3055140 RepID=UPI0025AB4C21|nr:hypothetical protein [Rhizobium sp. S96]MDM9622193.1 hypothetical protein [Rhizobium sp. S96]
MLQSLISLSDQKIELVIDAVREWCAKHGFDIDSGQGRRALTVAIDLVQSRRRDTSIASEMEQNLADCLE